MTKFNIMNKTLDELIIMSNELNCMEDKLNETVSDIHNMKVHLINIRKAMQNIIDTYQGESVDELLQ